MKKAQERTFTEGWNYCSDAYKSQLISGFLRENEQDIRWRVWIDFLWERLCSDDYSTRSSRDQGSEEEFDTGSEDRL